MAHSVTSTYEVLLLTGAGPSSAPAAERWSGAGPVPDGAGDASVALMDTTARGPPAPPRLPGLSRPSAVPGLDVSTCRLCAGAGGGWGAGKREEGLRSAPRPAELPHAEPPGRVPSCACCSSARCGCSPQVCSIPPLPCLRGDGLLCTSEVLMVGAPSVQMRPGFYQARVPCGDWEGTGPGTCFPMGAAGTPRTGSASRAGLVSPPATRPRCAGWGFLGLGCGDLGSHL